MPRRKRIDPDLSAPVDGDYALDKLFNKEPGRVYALYDDEDLARAVPQGARIERRAENGVRLAFDLGGTDGEVLKQRNLTLVSFTQEQWDRRHASAQHAADIRSKAIYADARERGFKADVQSELRN